MHQATETILPPAVKIYHPLMLFTYELFLLLCEKQPPLGCAAAVTTVRSLGMANIRFQELYLDVVANGISSRT